VPTSARPHTGGGAIIATSDTNLAADARSRKRLEWTLRIGAGMCFIGHGAFGLITKEAWVPYFAVAGIGRDMAFQLMPLVGAFDVLMGCLILLRPRPVVVYWMVVWAIWTALLRPLSDEPFWEALERAGNYGVPGAMAVWMVRPRGWRRFFGEAQFRALSPRVLATLRKILIATVALLLIGHGALGLIAKRGLVTNYASVVGPSFATTLTPDLGWLEIVLGGLVVVWQPVGLLVFIAAWKLATELLFVSAGAPVWEVIERGGSYAAPLALALVMRTMTRGRPRPTA
jgi:hypothetical protein